jgi:hypothetical protein
MEKISNIRDYARIAYTNIFLKIDFLKCLTSHYTRIAYINIFFRNMTINLNLNL